MVEFVSPSRSFSPCPVSLSVFFFLFHLVCLTLCNSSFDTGLKLIILKRKFLTPTQNVFCLFSPSSAYNSLFFTHFHLLQIWFMYSGFCTHFTYWTTFLTICKLPGNEYASVNIARDPFTWQNVNEEKVLLNTINLM